MSKTEALTHALMAIAGEESSFTQRFYEMLFESRPDTRELFGAYPLTEQEEMMRETLRSLATLDEYAVAVEQSDGKVGEAPEWLLQNLRALGDSHAEYGVTADMYESYRLVLIECAREIVGDVLDEGEVAALDEAITRVCELMNPEALQVQDAPARSASL